MIKRNVLSCDESGTEVQFMPTRKTSCLRKTKEHEKENEN